MFRPTDTQGAFRLLTRFWSLSFTTASPEAFDAFAKEYKATLALLKTAKVDHETIYSSQLLYALPASLSSLQTSLAVANQASLPRLDAILEVVRNEIHHTAPSTSGATLVATQDNSPPSTPCPACRSMHWLRGCPRRDESRTQQAKQRKERAAARRAATSPNPPSSPPTPASAPTTALAELLQYNGVEASFSGDSPCHPSPSRDITLDSGATHSMCGHHRLFSDLRACKPSPVGGLSGKNGLKVTGVGSLSVKLANGRVVNVNCVAAQVQP